MQRTSSKQARARSNHAVTHSSASSAQPIALDAGAQHLALEFDHGLVSLPIQFCFLFYVLLAKLWHAVKHTRAELRRLRRQRHDAEEWGETGE